MEEIAIKSKKASGLNSNRQSNPRAGRRWRTCFIAAPSYVNLHTIKALLEKRGIKPFVASEQPPNSASLLEHVTNTISKADLLIAILDPDQSNANVYYELGYAHALKKQILILIPPELKSIPADIMGMLYLRANVENSDAINFALDQALAVSKPAKHKYSRLVLKSQPIGRLADKLIEKLESLGDQANERDIEQIVVSAIEASGISVVVSSKQHEIGADLAIWADELDPWVGNPFLIEIKRQITSPEHMRELLNRISIYLQESNSRSALVLYVKGLTYAQYDLYGPRPYLKGHEYDFDSKNRALSSVLFMEVRQLLEKLRDNSFGEIIRDLRNRGVHQRDF